MGAMGRKYNNRRVSEDGYDFDSRAEHREYRTLKLRLHAGEISDLAVHPRYDFWIGDTKVGSYRPDFRYLDRLTGRCVVVDVKSKPTRTEAYRLRKRLMLALFGIEVMEVE